jgi:hypothetical protein
LVFDNYIDELVTKILADVTHIGIGTGATPLAESDTLLDNETLRKVVTEIQDDNTVIFEGYWDESEGNGVTYTEAGVFWNSATLSVNSGSLCAGGQINVEKDATNTITVSIEITTEAVNT